MAKRGPKPKPAEFKRIPRHYKLLPDLVQFIEVRSKSLDISNTAYIEKLILADKVAVESEQE